MSRRRTIRCMAIGAALLASTLAGPARPAVAGVEPPALPSGSQSVIETGSATVGPYGSIALVGDSLMVGSSREGGGWGPSLAQRLTERGWGPVRVRAGVGFQTGRTLPSTSPANLGAWLHQQRLAGFDPAVVVVNLGTNDIMACRGSSACAFAGIRHLLDTIGPERQVWWSQIVVPDQEYQRTWNEALRAVAAQRPNLVVWDWPTAQSLGQVPMAADGVHLQGGGAYRQRSVLMADDITARLGVARADGSIPASAPPVATPDPAWLGSTTVVSTTSLPSAPTTTVAAVVETSSTTTTSMPAVAPTTTTTPPAATTTVAVPEPYVPSLPQAGEALAYRAIEPRRLLDTRTTSSRIGPSVVRVLDVARLAGDLAPIDAVAVTVASVDPSGPGYLTVWPCGVPRPGTSAVNTESGSVRSAQVVTALGRDAELCVWSSVGTDLVVDLHGVFVDGVGDRFDPLLPTRVLDTRQTGRKRLLTLAAPTGSSAVAMTITVTGGARAGFLTAYGCTPEVPLASTLNWEPGETVAGATFAPSGPGGLICLATSSDVDVIVDVTGTFRPEGRLGFRPAVATRMIDTRDGAGGHVGPLEARRAYSAATAPAGAGAVSGALTIVDPDRAGFLTATVCGTPPGLTSSVNAPASGVRTSGLTVALSAGGLLCMHSHTSADAVFDVTGWWTA